MRVFLTLMVIVGGFPIGLVIGNKIMMAVFNIPTRLAAANQGKTRWWDLTLLGSIASVIGLGLYSVNWLFAGTTHSTTTQMPAIVSWLFAAWWLLGGIRDFNIPRYRAGGGIGRYREPLPLFLSLSASLDLVLLGYFMSTSQRELTFLTLFIFLVIYLKWMMIAKRSRNGIK